MRSAQAMDCIGVGTVGYIALAYTVHSNNANSPPPPSSASAAGQPTDAAPNPIVLVANGSPVFRLTEVLQAAAPPASVVTHIEVVQYFNEMHLNRVYLLALGAEELYFFQSFSTDQSDSGEDGKSDGDTEQTVRSNTNCLVYKWSGYHFDLIDELPCSNTMQIQPFFVKSDMHIAIANYRDANGE